MKYLLDTHIWLWSLSEPRRLSRRVRNILQRPEHQIWLSPISVWEALLLHAKHRIQLPAKLHDWLPAALASFRQAPMTHAIVLAAHELPTNHPDPADRFLAATAQVMDLTLITSDQRLLELDGVTLLANSI